MTGLLQNLARIGRGEPVPGAARVALPPRFGAPVRTDAAPVIGTWPHEELESSPPAAMPDITRADDPLTEAQAPQRGQMQPEEKEAPLHFAAKVGAAAAPLQLNEAQPESRAGVALPAAPRDPPRHTQPHDPLLRDPPRPRDEAAALPALPLGQAVIASQAQRRRETPPVIRVTIDRIDIRSPEPPRAARATRPAPKPSVSLSDYLRRPGPGGGA